jgi:hypothetical protein
MVILWVTCVGRGTKEGPKVPDPKFPKSLILGKIAPMGPTHYFLIMEITNCR